MLTLNLLPQKQKEAFANEKKMRFLLFYSAELLFILILFSFLLFSIYVYINIYLNAENTIKNAAYSDQNIQKYESLEKEAENYSKRAKEIVNVKNSIVAISPFLKDFTDMLPTEFIINGIFYSKNIFDIEGATTTRNEALKLEKILRENAKITNLNFPVENYLNLEKIKFSFKIK